MKNLKTIDKIKTIFDEESGMRLAVRSLLKLPIHKDAKNKIKELNAIVKEYVGTDVGYIGHVEEDDE